MVTSVFKSFSVACSKTVFYRHNAKQVMKFIMVLNMMVRNQILIGIAALFGAGCRGNAFGDHSSTCLRCCRPYCS